VNDNSSSLKTFPDFGSAAHREGRRHVGPPLAVKTQFANRLHEGKQATPFVNGFGMMHLAKDHGTSVGQSPDVAGSVCGSACNVA
jgi:hypothetical protein